VDKRAFVVNPAAGRRPAGFAEVLRGRFPAASVRITEAPGDGERLALRALEEGAEAVVACGGDGTFREVASAVGGRATLGFVPLGTVNLMALGLGIPTDPDRALEVVEAGQTAAVYGGRCRPDEQPEPRLFFIGVSAGPDADAVHAVGAAKRLLGRYAYAQRFLARLLRRVPGEIRCDWGEGERAFGQLLVLRSPYYGGPFRVSERLSLRRPGLEVLGVEGSRRAVARLFWDAFRSRVRERQGSTRREVEKVRLSLPKPGRCQIDGDPLTARRLTLWADREPLRVLAGLG
jgi:diacylglycerol kinase family enzyme